MPTDRAPSRLTGVSSTSTASSASTPSSLRRWAKISASGLRIPTTELSTTTVMCSMGTIRRHPRPSPMSANSRTLLVTTAWVRPASAKAAAVSCTIERSKGSAPMRRMMSRIDRSIPIAAMRSSISGHASRRLRRPTSSSCQGCPRSPARSPKTASDSCAWVSPCSAATPLIAS